MPLHKSMADLSELPRGFEGVFSPTRAMMIPRTVSFHPHEGATTEREIYTGLFRNGIIFPATEIEMSGTAPFTELMSVKPFMEPSEQVTRENIDSIFVNPQTGQFPSPTVTGYLTNSANSPSGGVVLADLEAADPSWRGSMQSFVEYSVGADARGVTWYTSGLTLAEYSMALYTSFHSDLPAIFKLLQDLAGVSQGLLLPDGPAGAAFPELNEVSSFPTARVDGKGVMEIRRRGGYLPLRREWAGRMAGVATMAEIVYERGAARADYAPVTPLYPAAAYEEEIPNARFANSLVNLRDQVYWRFPSLITAYQRSATRTIGVSSFQPNGFDNGDRLAAISPIKNINHELTRSAALATAKIIHDWAMGGGNSRLHLEDFESENDITRSVLASVGMGILPKEYIDNLMEVGYAAMRGSTSTNVTHPVVDAFLHHGNVQSVRGRCRPLLRMAREQGRFGVTLGEESTFGTYRYICPEDLRALLIEDDNAITFHELVEGKFARRMFESPVVAAYVDRLNQAINSMVPSADPETLAATATNPGYGAFLSLFLPPHGDRSTKPMMPCLYREVPVGASTGISCRGLLSILRFGTDSLVLTPLGNMEARLPKVIHINAILENIVHTADVELAFTIACSVVHFARRQLGIESVRLDGANLSTTKWFKTLTRTMKPFVTSLAEVLMKDLQEKYHGAGVAAMVEIHAMDERSPIWPLARQGVFNLTGDTNDANPQGNMPDAYTDIPFSPDAGLSVGSTVNVDARLRMDCAFDEVPSDLPVPLSRQLRINSRPVPATAIGFVRQEEYGRVNPEFYSYDTTPQTRREGAANAWRIFSNVASSMDGDWRDPTTQLRETYLSTDDITIADVIARMPNNSSVVGHWRPDADVRMFNMADVQDPSVDVADSLLALTLKPNSSNKLRLDSKVKNVVVTGSTRKGVVPPSMLEFPSLNMVIPSGLRWYAGSALLRVVDGVLRAVGRGFNDHHNVIEFCYPRKLREQNVPEASRAAHRDLDIVRAAPPSDGGGVMAMYGLMPERMVVRRVLPVRLSFYTPRLRRANLIADAHNRGDKF